MIKVSRHGNRIIVRNPVNGQENTMINVVFEEMGRSGADLGMSGSSSYLDRMVGTKTGLDQVRVHTQPIKEAAIAQFPIGKQFPGHINRELYSTPQIRQQEDVPARMINGKLTYFKTSLDDNEVEDKDYRISTEALLVHRPNLVFGARVGAAEVRTENAEHPVEEVVGVIQP